MCKKLTQLSIILLSFSWVFSQVNYIDVSEDLGINVAVGNSPLGNGISFADFNKDGFDDISVCTSADDIPRFYLNIDGVFFSEVDLNLGLTAFQNKQINWVDYDNDGDRDLFITSNTNGNRLFNNNGNLVFTDVTQQVGFTLENTSSYGASWADVNNDGCLDVYISNHSISDTGSPNLFYLNNCDGSFTEVSNTIGLANTLAPTFCSGFIDINNDGWLDLYVANDRFSPNFLYKNNGDGTFTDISQSSGTGVVMDAMTVTTGDINNDGFIDIYVTNTPESISTSFQGNALFLNNGDETFTNVSSDAGTMFYGFAWGASFLDVDNDGDEDLYVSSSYDGNQYGYPSYALYDNQNNNSFTQSLDMGFETDDHKSYGNAIGDYNLDGQLDIVVLNNDNQRPCLWENTNTIDENYIKILLQGTESNIDGVGSKIEISINGQKQYRTLRCGDGYLSQNSFMQHFGLGDARVIDYIKVNWPSGLEDIFFDVESNQVFNVLEGASLSLDESFSNNVEIYPSLVKDFMYVSTESPDSNIQLFNDLGQLVWKIELHERDSELDLTFLDSGVYFLKLENSLGALVKKTILKQ